MEEVKKIRLKQEDGAYKTYGIQDERAREGIDTLRERVDALDGNVTVKVIPAGGTFYRYGEPCTDNWCEKFVAGGIAAVRVETTDAARKFNLREQPVEGIYISSGQMQGWRIVAPVGYRIKGYRLSAVLRTEGQATITASTGQEIVVTQEHGASLAVTGLNTQEATFMTTDSSTIWGDRQIWILSFEISVKRTDRFAMKTEVDAALQALIQQVSASLANYYLKTETYSKSEVNTIVGAIKQFRYMVADALPEASADTMGIIYLIPGTNPKTQNVKDEFITVLDGSAYKWEQIGSTTVDLSGYSTTTEMNAAIASALTAYYTKTQVDGMVATINAGIASAVDRVFFIEKSFGKYDGQREIVLQQEKAGKYVNTDGGETTASGYGISTPITLNAGDILLIPSAQAVPASVSVVARMVDRTYQKVIAYIYTYRTDYPELPATATADYDATLVYTAVYDESGDTPVLTGWTRNGETYTTLPATREVREQFYEPLVRQAVSAMPSTGYYIYLSPTAMTVVVSGLTATVSGGTALVVGWGIFKNITTNFVGAPGQSVLAQAFAVLFAAIDGLKAQLENLGETKAVSIDFENSPKLCGQDMYIVGSGAPASPVVPTMIGQEYLDVTNRKCYKAFRVTGAISDWVLLN